MARYAQRPLQAWRTHSVITAAAVVEEVFTTFTQIKVAVEFKDAKFKQLIEKIVGFLIVNNYKICFSIRKLLK